MVSPVTNCLPSMRMARSTAVRITGSPLRAIRRVSAVDRLFSLVVATSLPVITRPQVAALTKIDGLWPRWARQSPRASLSRISRSAVAASGTRSSASARHIRAMPSWLESENSCISASTPLAPVRLLRTSLDQPPSDGLHCRHLLGRHARRIDHPADAGLLVLAVGPGDGVAKRRLRVGERAERHGGQLPKMSTGTREMMWRTGVAYLRRACSTMSCRSQAERSSGWVEITIRSGWKPLTASSKACSGR